jgi:hypothetical protein
VQSDSPLERPYTHQSSGSGALIVEPPTHLVPTGVCCRQYYGAVKQYSVIAQRCSNIGLTRSVVFESLQREGHESANGNDNGGHRCGTRRALRVCRALSSTAHRLSPIGTSAVDRRTGCFPMLGSDREPMPLRRSRFDHWYAPVPRGLPDGRSPARSCGFMRRMLPDLLAPWPS